MGKDNEKNEQELMDKVNQAFDEIVEDVKSMVQEGEKEESK
ncbi:hypothetical protein [Robertmurraya kyonggiensis]|nr:hypothetical protein [Robertmurraya kyonggiensis]